MPPDRVEQVAERHGRTAFRPYLGQLFYGFNLKNPKFADVRFREAIVRAIDRDAIVRAIYGAAAQRLDGLVPDGVPGFQPDACGERCGYDPERAQALVAEVFGGQPRARGRRSTSTTPAPSGRWPRPCRPTCRRSASPPPCGPTPSPTT